MTGAALRKLAIRERARRARLKGAVQVDTAKICHRKQATLVDTIVLRKRRNIAALAGRQSGKSHGAAALAPILLLSRTPGVNAIVVTSTYATCKKMAFLPAVELNRQLGLGGDPKFGQEMSIAFPNGSTVYYLGADSEKTVQRLRGTPNLILVVIDEAGIYSPETLAEMIKAVRPGLRPRAGTLAVMGTPSRSGKQGTWYDITENPEYEQHRFDYRDNDRVPEFDRVEELIDEDLRAQFPTMTPAEARRTAWFLREYLALFEVDLAEKVYQLTNDNLVDDIPGELPNHASGGDIGVSACDALVSLGWDDAATCIYVDGQEEASSQDTLEYAKMVKAHAKRFTPFRIWVDPGGLGDKAIRTVKALHPGIPIEAAEKPPIGVQVHAVNVLLQSGRLKIKRGSKLALELATPTWVDGILGGKIDEHGKHSDLVPSLRYVAVAVARFLPSVAAPVAPEDAKREAYLEAVARSERIARAANDGVNGYESAEFVDDLSSDLYSD